MFKLKAKGLVRAWNVQQNAKVHARLLFSNHHITNLVIDSKRVKVYRDFFEVSKKKIKIKA
jgi:hypothetical protein